MVDREKVVDGLQEAAAYFRSSFDAMYGTVACEKFRNWTDAIEQVIALLKAQEARVMTLQEVLAAEVVYAEDIDKDEIIPVLINGRMFDSVAMVRAHLLDGRSHLFYPALNDYGKRWRCWTSRPDQATRGAEPWE